MISRHISSARRLRRRSPSVARKLCHIRGGARGLAERSQTCPRLSGRSRFQCRLKPWERGQRLPSRIGFTRIGQRQIWMSGRFQGGIAPQVRHRIHPGIR